MTKILSKNRPAFTLVELLVVIGILTILFTIAIVALNPSRQFSQANNTKRRNDVLAILNAVNQYMADNKGDLPAGITGTPQNIGVGGSAVDICADLVPDYIAEMPYDPTTGSYTSCSTYDTQYSISTTTGNRVTVTAPDAELSETISVTR